MYLLAISVLKMADRSRGRPEVSLFNSYYSFPWIAPVNFDPYLIMLSVKQVPFIESLV